jgi:hypothetical protein
MSRKVTPNPRIEGTSRPAALGPSCAMLGVINGAGAECRHGGCVVRDEVMAWTDARDCWLSH